MNANRAKLDTERSNRIPVKTAGRVRFVNLTEIEWIDAAGNYVRLNTAAGTFLHRETMAGMEQRLDPDRFVRIHRSTIVAIDRVREIEFLSHGDYAVRLTNGKRLTVSRTYRERMRPLLR